MHSHCFTGIFTFLLSFKEIQTRNYSGPNITLCVIPHVRHKVDSPHSNVPWPYAYLLNDENTFCCLFIKINFTEI